MKALMIPSVMFIALLVASIAPVEAQAQGFASAPGMQKNPVLAQKLKDVHRQIQQRLSILKESLRSKLSGLHIKRPVISKNGPRNSRSG